MHSTPLRFNLIDILSIALRWKKQIVIFAFLAAVIAAGYFLFQKNQYRAYGSFFPGSAVTSGRINLFRETQQDWIDFFGGENEVDRCFVIGNSSEVMSHLIRKFDMAKHYQIDVEHDNNGPKKVYKRFAKNFSFTRSGYKHLEVSFMDEDADLAHQIVNEAMNRTEDILRDIYKNINTQLALAIDTRADSIANQLTVYTDSLIAMRVQYNFYDVVSPGRSNLMMGNAKGSGIQYATALEKIQNIEEIKDKLAINKAKYISLSNEFKTATFKGFPMIHVVQWATPNGPKVGPYRIIGVLSTFIIALLFGICIAVLIEIIQRSKSSIL